jgi:thioredoxin-related protein
MKFIIAALLFATVTSSPQWHTDFNEAKQVAAQDHRYILLNFSGSDWCIPCIKLHKEIFDSDSFKSFATNRLVLINADFPRLKKNHLTKEQTEKNEALADQYNHNGSFPYTVLLSADGKLIKSFDGYPGISPEAFVAQLKQVTGD